MSTRARLAFSPFTITLCLSVGSAACRTDDVLLSTHIGFTDNWVVAVLDEGSGWFANAEAYPPDTAPVILPISVSRGVPFPVKIYSFSGGCTWATDSVYVSVQADTALLIPYDRLYAPAKPGVPFACTADLRFGVRTVQVTLTQAGVTTVQVRGWSNGPPQGLITLSRSVTVSP